MSDADSMAQVRHPPTPPTLHNFTGYSDHRNTPPFTSPSFRPSLQQDRSYSSVRLPPIRMPPGEPVTQRSTQALSINNLISNQDEPPRRSDPQRPHPPYSTSRPPTESPASSYADSPGRAVSQWPSGSAQSSTYPPQALSKQLGPAHYLDHPPTHQRSSGYQSQPQGYYHNE